LQVYAFATSRSKVENDTGVDAKHDDDDAELSSLCKSVLRDDMDWFPGGHKVRRAGAVGLVVLLHQPVLPRPRRHPPLATVMPWRLTVHAERASRYAASSLALLSQVRPSTPLPVVLVLATQVWV
jgi:hypothetical protein